MSIFSSLTSPTTQPSNAPSCEFESVSVGDEVIYGKYSGSEIEVNGEDVKILRESEILAKVVN